MRHMVIFFVSLMASVVNCDHFELKFPPARGPRHESSLSAFCGGHRNSTSNRTKFPLKGGFCTALNATQGTVELYISTAQDPIFADFPKTPNVSKSLTSAEVTRGVVCPFLNLSNINGLRDGQNMTIQFGYKADGVKVWQCADVTLTKKSVPTPTECEKSGAMSNFAVGSLSLLLALAGLSGVLLL